MARAVPVVVFGLGGVGRALVRQLLEARALHASRYGAAFEVVAVADSSAALFAAAGRGAAMDEAELRAALKHKEGGQPLRALGGAEAMPEGGPPELLRPLLGSRPLVVDCTSSERTAEAMALALEAGGGAVTANKKPLTASMDMFRRLLRPEHAARLGAESTVGAGTPMVAAARRVVAGGDTVSKASGCFSGTLGYLCSGLEAGERYSEIVRRAHKLGYTEPDPRDDLGGTDVARKALILARLFGATLEMSDVAVEPLYPERLASLDVPAFLEALPSLDEEYAARSAAAAAAGATLRYAASVDLSRGPAAAVVRVGLESSPLESPLGSLKGTANMVALETRIYGDEPLVIRGSGAGVEITAAGVIADMVAVAAAL